MGIKLIILLALLIGVLYGIHILVQDYQAITAPKLLRLLFKRDVSSHHQYKPHVRWRKVLQYDPIQCARLLYCDLGVEAPDSEVGRGFIFMLTLEPREEDKSSLDVFKKAYQFGRLYRKEEHCRNKYPMCVFKAKLLIDLIQYLLQNH
ncbi:uncharacterized protein [Epargyreus clarus]|uniref:uncharacterized protein n=1 Tax=Epargyreus clarus TaxID=520877 RepID=UPI003C2C0B61